MVLVIAGASAKRTVTETDQLFDGSALPEWACTFLDAAREGGMTLREAVKPLARHLGVNPLGDVPDRRRAIIVHQLYFQ